VTIGCPSIICTRIEALVPATSGIELIAAPPVTDVAPSGDAAASFDTQSA